MSSKSLCNNKIDEHKNNNTESKGYDCPYTAAESLLRICMNFSRFTQNVKDSIDCEKNAINLTNFKKNKSKINNLMDQLYFGNDKIRIFENAHILALNNSGTMAGVENYSITTRKRDDNTSLLLKCFEATVTNNSTTVTKNLMQSTSIDGFFNRKRGRPPKNRCVEFYKNQQKQPQAIFTSFKLERHELKKFAESAINKKNFENNKLNEQNVVDLNKNLDCFSQKFLSNQIAMTLNLQLQPDALEFCQTPLKKLSIVRAAGTFYPENSNLSNYNAKCRLNMCDNMPNGSANNLKLKDLDFSTKNLDFSSENLDFSSENLDFSTKKLDFSSKNYIDNDETNEMPEDLSIKTKNNYFDVAKTSTFVINEQNLQKIYQNAIETSPTPTPTPTPTATPTATLFKLCQKHKKLISDFNIPKDFALESHSKKNNSVLKQKLTKYKNSGKNFTTDYAKYRFDEDCGSEKCNYRKTQTHFHCNRFDCQYSFCDKTRFLQHTMRHERLDMIMGSDFQQFRSNVVCGFEKCNFNIARNDETFTEKKNKNKKSCVKKLTTHFHCKKCHFSCTETHKVTAHRRFHSKKEFLLLAGFRKVTNGENCMAVVMNANDASEMHKSRQNICLYNMKNTHYHCIVCNCSLQTRAQISTHKHKF